MVRIFQGPDLTKGCKKNSFEISGTGKVRISTKGTPPPEPYGNKMWLLKFSCNQVRKVIWLWLMLKRLELVQFGWGTNRKSKSNHIIGVLPPITSIPWGLAEEFGINNTYIIVIEEDHDQPLLTIKNYSEVFGQSGAKLKQINYSCFPVSQYMVLTPCPPLLSYNYISWPNLGELLAAPSRLPSQFFK